MSLRTKKQTLTILCPDFEKPEGGKGCRHYQKPNCSLDLHPICEEWLRKNPRKKALDAPSFVNEVSSDYRLAVIAGTHFDEGWQDRVRGALGLDGDGSGTSVDAVATDADEGHSGKDRPTYKPPVIDETTEGFRFQTNEEIDSWKKLRCEILFQTMDGTEVWLVPEYTKAEGRNEVTPEDAMSLARITSAFPGASIAEFNMKGGEG